ncbi:MAG: dihydrolipoyl dehydrogenase [Bacteroidetes bacterium]|nr:dihydrolipoyl dehydrogenase [Bacteroidota bacterium]
MNTTFDIIVIGSGPGGYAAAIRASQLGYNTAIVEKYSALGGTCTNVGCIPSKALLDSTEHYYTAKHKFANHGIAIHSMELNFGQLMKRKQEVVKQNVSGLNFLMKKNKITVIEGKASFINNKSIRVHTKSGEEKQYNSSYFIIATGSKPVSLPGINIDKNRIITSTEALSLTEKPASMIIIGGGVIGVEMASVFSRVGTQTSIIEYADSLIPAMDKELGRELKKILSKQGIDIMLNHKLQAVTNMGDHVHVSYIDKDGSVIEREADYCLITVGRKAYTKGLDLEYTKIALNEKGQIQTNEFLQTAEENIYAIGDVIQGPMLAHKAEEEAIFAAEHIHGQKPHIHYELIPGVVYTWPEVASVGKSEEQLKSDNIPYRIGKFPFIASGRARAAMEADGFVKVLTGTKYGEVLGVHIIGPRAADLIAQAVLGMHYETTDEDMFRMPYAHPTYSEALKESFLVASGQGAINL